jgi:hypothetical protein
VYVRNWVDEELRGVEDTPDSATVRLISGPLTASTTRERSGATAVVAISSAFAVRPLNTAVAGGFNHDRKDPVSLT